MTSMRQGMRLYRGMHYPVIFQPEWVQRLWRRFMCRHERHLFSEVASSGEPFHYLVCDPCQLMVVIESIDETYTEYKRETDPR